MKILAAISFGLTLVVSCLFLVVPIYSGRSSESPSVRHTTLLQVNGPHVLIILAIPVLMALVPVVLPEFWVGIVAGVALAIFAILGGFSIGLFYAPERRHDADGRFAVGACAERVTATHPQTTPPSARSAPDATLRIVRRVGFISARSGRSSY